mgnify:CR=1 FL=1
MVQLNVLARPNSAVWKTLTRLVFLGLALLLIAASVLPALAQETVYSDPTGKFTATIPAVWNDESSAEYALFTHSGVSIYLISVEGSDLQAGIAAAVAQLAPTLSAADVMPMGDFSAPSGTWTQVLYSHPDGGVGNAVAQSNGSTTVVLLVTADSMAAMQAILADANAILASVSIEGALASTTEPEVEAPAVPTASGGITFPELTGSYAVGRIDYVWSDDSRDETNTPEENDPRIIHVWFWYPAAPNADSEIAPYLPEAAGTIFQQFTGISPDAVHSHAYAAPPVLPDQSGYPVVIAAPGNGYNAAFSASLIEEITSHGYIVVGVDHAYNSLLTTLPDGQVIMRPNVDLTETDELFATRIADLAFVIDQLAQVNDSDTVLHGSLDLDHLGIWGHSFGGSAAGEVCRTDSRCQAVIISDVPLRGESAEVGVPQPIMLLDADILSGEDWVHEQELLAGQTMPDAQLVAEFMDDRNAERNATAKMLLENSPDAYRVGIGGARHNNFTDIPLLALAQPALLPQMGGIASIDALRGQRVISDYLVAFFDTNLKGERSPLLDGDSADYPEVTFERGQR